MTIIVSSGDMETGKPLILQNHSPKSENLISVCNVIITTISFFEYDRTEEYMENNNVQTKTTSAFVLTIHHSPYDRKGTISSAFVPPPPSPIPHR